MATDPADLTRRERRKLEVHNRILEAAVALFEERGFGATKVSEICERADVAHKTFFNHFPSKQHLLRELSLVALEQLLLDLEDARKRASSTRERVSIFFARVAENARDAGPMHRELLTELIHVVHESGTEGEQTMKLHDAFGAIVRDGVDAGDVTTAHDLETLIEMLMGAFYVLMFNWANLDDYPIRERAVAAARFLGDALSTPEE
jgi:AcrR family transcriptional regulator